MAIARPRDFPGPEPTCTGPQAFMGGLPTPPYARLPLFAYALNDWRVFRDRYSVGLPLNKFVCAIRVVEGPLAQSLVAAYVPTALGALPGAGPPYVLEPSLTASLQRALEHLASDRRLAPADLVGGQIRVYLDVPYYLSLQEIQISCAAIASVLLQRSSDAPRPSPERIFDVARPLVAALTPAASWTPMVCSLFAHEHPRSVMLLDRTRDRIDFERLMYEPGAPSALANAEIRLHEIRREWLPFPVENFSLLLSGTAQLDCSDIQASPREQRKVDRLLRGRAHFRLATVRAALRRPWAAEAFGDLMHGAAREARLAGLSTASTDQAYWRLADHPDVVGVKTVSAHRGGAQLVLRSREDVRAEELARETGTAVLLSRVEPVRPNCPWTAPPAMPA